jgi:tetratricopeptide (TPR) repeat protein
VARGDLPARALVEIGLEHLTALCPHCQAEWLAWQRELSAGPVQYGPALRALPAVLGRHAGDAKEKEEAAKRDFAELLRLPRADRLARIDRARVRFRGTALASLLLDESRRHMPLDAEKSYEFAETAEAVLRHSPGAPRASDLHALASTFLGNSLRARGLLKEAQQRFELARFLMRHGGVTDPAVVAEVDLYEGGLAIDRRRFEEAERLLNRSVHLYRVGGDLAQTAHPLLALGRLHAQRSQFSRAIEALQSAADRVDLRDRRLALYIRHNLALYLCEAGSFESAAATLRETRDLYEEFPDPFTQLRLGWLDGKIAAGLGRTEEAERAFLDVRAGFLERKLGYDAALVSLDLAMLYLRQSRTAELQELAEQMRPVFEAEDVHREALAALLLFQEGVRQETLTLDVLEEMAAYLKAARGNPGLRFR